MPLQQFLPMAFFAALALVGLVDHRPASLALIPDPLDAGGYPTIAGTLLLISLGLTLIEDLRLKTRGKVVTIAPMNKTVALMLLILVGYVMAFEYIGFYVSTFAFCAISLLVCFKEEGTSSIGVFAYCLGTLLFWGIILKGFNLYLPSGLLL